MKIINYTVHQTADLADIAISKHEVDRLTSAMNKMLMFKEKFNELDTNAIKPLVYKNE